MTSTNRRLLQLANSATHLDADHAIREYCGRHGSVGFGCVGDSECDSEIWMTATRGELNDDPVVFACTDGPSWVAMAIIAAIVVSAAMMG
jgi:hypothetical protein